MRIKDDLLPASTHGGSRTLPVTLVVLHATAGGSYSGARAAYVTRGVSAHYTIDVDGTIYRNVPEELIAWHAGQSQWGELRDLNRHSIGIELVGLNQPDSHYPEIQVKAATELVVDICRRHSLGERSVVTHAMISPGRKTDPANFTAYHLVLEWVRGLRELRRRVFLNGLEVTGKREEVEVTEPSVLVVNASADDKVFVALKAVG
jgi:N-acetyl-anhydromuramyl-L-alanine amidase AmpD